MGAVGNHLMAVDHPQQYRPEESPANRCITGGAGDAVGIYQGSFYAGSLAGDVVGEEGYELRLVTPH
jgi:hypothetical protein